MKTNVFAPFAACSLQFALYDDEVPFAIMSQISPVEHCVSEVIMP